MAVINSISKSRPKQSYVMKEICKDDLGDTGPELFGPEVWKITERANTIDALNKAIGKVDNPTPASTSTAPPRSSSFFYPSARPQSTGESQAEGTPRTTGPRNTNRGTEAQRHLSVSEEVHRQQMHDLATKDQPVGGTYFLTLGIWGSFATRQLVAQLPPTHHRAVADPGPRDSKPAPKKCDRKHSQHKGLFSPMFTVPKKDGSWRPIINLKTPQYNKSVTA